ncbi:MAG: NYN domain-containing protein [Coriobacteriia bacterium]|nr:NYN domain-containing protein [Coriobacteriia bacterium]
MAKKLDEYRPPLKVMETAVMVDGGFYQKRAKLLFGEKSAKDRADELAEYCMKHIKKTGDRHLYRVFYYDCPPSENVVFNPLTGKNFPLSKTPLYSWSKEFHEELTHKRKFAIRMGELLETQGGYSLKPEALKALLSGKKGIEDLTESDLTLNIRQKGVDMKLGLDIASLAHGKIVNQIIMIAGDSDFVPAAKLARREGIDFILDPMWSTISKSLNEHIDGLEQCTPRPTPKK